MSADRDELSELRQRIARLTPQDRMFLVEHILSDIRRTHFTDHEAEERAMDEMIADPEFQRMMTEPYPIPEDARAAG